MTTLDDLISDMSQPEDRSGALAEAFAEAFDLEDWTFVQQGSIPYGILEGESSHELKITALQVGGGLEWQLNGITFMNAADSGLGLETRRVLLAQAAQRARYVPKAPEEKDKSKSKKT